MARPRTTRKPAAATPTTAPIIVIGGDAAGMSAASAIKRRHPNGHVIVFERSPHISYSMCGMPYWIGGVVQSADELVALTVDRARDERGIDVRLHHDVVAIDRAAHTVAVRRLDTGEEFTHAYSSLIYATGARPARPPIPGIELPGVFALRSLTDAHAIQEFLTARKLKRAVVVGAGYIGLELVEALRERRISVHVVESLGQIMPNFDTEMVEDVREHLRDHGVHLHLNARVEAIEQAGDALRLTAQTQHQPPAQGKGKGKPEPPSRLAADLVLVATGVLPNSELAAAAGLELGASQALRVDARMRTSDPDIFAAGDCVELPHLVTGEPTWIPLAPAANKCGRIAGALGEGDAFPGIVGTAVVKVFDYTLACTGLTERAARAAGAWGAAGEAVGAVTIGADDRAGYYPGAAEIRTKLVFDLRDGRLLGGQLVGKAGVNKRIDILATALHARMTLAEIATLDLSYAPPYSPVYDPILVAAGEALEQVRG